MLTIVAEIGMNHDGRWDRAHELIRRAAEAGADIAKFQFGWRCNKGEINHITPTLAHRLSEWCDYYGIEFMASIINDDALELAKEVGPARYKIASRTVTENPKLVEKVLAEGKETFVSLGWWVKEGRQGWPFGPPSNTLRYIYCISQYPTYPADLAAMPERFGEDGYYGWSDHTHGIETPLVAIARGARFIEKHFTLDKTIVSVHNDHVLSAEPDELTTLCHLGRRMAKVAAAAEGRIAGVEGAPKEE
jgi:sialic acid synthase SpsE